MSIIKKGGPSVICSLFEVRKLEHPAREYPHTIFAAQSPKEALSCEDIPLKIRNPLLERICHGTDGF